MSYPVYKRELGADPEIFEECKAKIMQNAEEYGMEFEFTDSNAELDELLQAARERVSLKSTAIHKLSRDRAEQK